MKKVLLAALMLVPAGLIAQTGNAFHITGQLKNIALPVVYLSYIKDGKPVVDSSKVNNGAYAFNGELSDNTMGTVLDTRPNGMIRVLGTKSVQVFLAPGSFQITHIDSFSNVVFTGSDDNTDYMAYLAALKPYQERQKAFFSKFMEAMNNKDTAATNALRRQRDGIMQEANEQVVYPFIKKHTASPIALYVLVSQAVLNRDTKMLQSLFDMLSSDIKNSTSGKAFQERLTNGGKINGGTPYKLQ